MSYKIEVKDDFIKEYLKLQPKLSNKVKEFIFKTLPNSSNPASLFSKMTGYKTYYKKRFGDFRLGVEIIHSTKTIYVLTIMHRKEVYRHFPPP
jgi:mRNA-degrading endonuclease RelE of RelBE toxin-antitoxin system